MSDNQMAKHHIYDACDDDDCSPIRPPAMPKTTIVNRVFYIDVSNCHPNDIPGYMDAVKKNFINSEDTSSEISKLRSTGQWEDFFIPVRNAESDVGVWGRIKSWWLGSESKSPTRIELLKVEI